MKHLNWILGFLFLLSYGGIASAQSHEAAKLNPATHPETVKVEQSHDEDGGTLDAQRERAALQIFLKLVQKQIVSAAEAMPADKYGFAPTEGEFTDVRTFGQQVKHLAATNHILAAAALGEDPPADAGDEQGPEAVLTKPQILDYLNASFVHLDKAIDAIGDKNSRIKASPISPLSASKATRLALTVEAMIHAFDHYGQMVEYLRLNGVVPPASRP
jgi:uncharacterized damage-inducible protein DinB